MSYEPVDVYVKDQFAQPIVGVIVKIFSANGGVFYTQQPTDADGKASFLLSTQSYSMRFYKFRATFAHPQLFSVLEAPALNTFDVVGEVFSPPVSSDIRLCRCSGFFRNPDGSPQKYLDMHFFPEFSPIVLEGAAVTPRKVVVRTDENGYVQLDLIKCGQYRVTIEAQEAEERYVRVPELSSTNLPDLLYPVIRRVSFDPEGPWTIAAGDELEVTPTVYDSAGAVLHGTAQSDVNWAVSDRTIASLSVSEFKLTIRAIAAGSIELQATRADQSVIHIPDVAIAGQPIPTTIT